MRVHPTIWDRTEQRLYLTGKEGQRQVVRVLNRRTHGVPEGAVYVGRPTKWGNPFRNGTRTQNVLRYATWIMGQTHLLADLHELRGKDLVCWCAPKKCHADILIRLANEED